MLRPKFPRRAVFALACLGVCAAVPVQSQDFSGPAFQINRDRVTMNFASACSKSQTVIVPTVYINIEARNSTTARGGSVIDGGMRLKSRVFVEGMDQAWLQGMARAIQDDLVAQLRAAGKTVLTWDDVKDSVAGAARMADNPKFGLPTHNSRFAKDVDFVSVSPSSEQALDYGTTGPAGLFHAAASDNNAEVLVPEIWLTMPQVGSQFTSNWSGMEGSITFDPSMRLFAANLYSEGPKGSGCLIVVPEHGGRIPAPVAGHMVKLAEDLDNWGDYRRSAADFAFTVDRDAVQTGTMAVGKSFNKLITDVAVKGKK